jgi:hypothetical protein
MVRSSSEKCKDIKEKVKAISPCGQGLDHVVKLIGSQVPASCKMDLLPTVQMLKSCNDLGFKHSSFTHNATQSSYWINCHCK